MIKSKLMSVNKKLLNQHEFFLAIGLAQLWSWVGGAAQRFARSERQGGGSELCAKALEKRKMSQKEKKIISLRGTQSPRGLSLNAEQDFYPKSVLWAMYLLSFVFNSFCLSWSRGAGTVPVYLRMQPYWLVRRWFLFLCKHTKFPITSMSCVN